MPPLPSAGIARRPVIILAVAILAGSAALIAWTAVRSEMAQPASPVLRVSGDPKPGVALRLTGASFRAGEAIAIRLDGEIVPSLAQVPVGPDGGFSVELTVPKDLGPGRHAIEATDSSGAALAVAYVTALIAGTPVPTGPPGIGVNPEIGGGVGPSPAGEPTPEPTPTPVPASPSHGSHGGGTAASSAPPSIAGPMPGAGEHGGSLDCSGYREPRVWVESQDWWNPIPKLGGMGHMHVGMCFPVGQAVSGTVAFDVRVVLHHNAGTLTRIKMQDDFSTEHVVMRPNQAIGDGVYWYTVNIDTRNMPDGLRLFRFYADLEHPNGNTQTGRPILPLRVENGGSDQDWSDRDRELRATAWYREAKPELDWGYVGAVIEDYRPGPYKGSATFEARCFVNGEDGGDAQGSPDLASWSVHIDPDFHQNNEGIVVAKGAGQLKSDITIPTGGLSHGWHRLVIRCNQALGDRDHAAVGVFSILVGH